MPWQPDKTSAHLLGYSPVEISRPRIAFPEHAVEYHGDDTIAKLPVNGLTVVPLVHPARALAREARVAAPNSSKLVL
jgi:hypothetical protein